MKGETDDFSTDVEKNATFGAARPQLSFRQHAKQIHQSREGKHRG
ncbi:MAG TPA: hypothetical protein VL635_23190 [Trinickia sp.]|jgi:hypothetical protein|nr:hypothetical protein [Trinickia sp.]